MKINCHCHIFNVDCVPEKFRNKFFIDDGPLAKFSFQIARAIFPEITHPGKWIRFYGLSIEEIAFKLALEMDDAGIEIATPLTLDMDFCLKYGPGKKRFAEQLKETTAATTAVNEKYGRTRFLPFIGADPHRKNVAELVIGSLENGSFAGVKLYPVMGFSPDDKRLYPIYDHCAKKKIPITTHCYNGGLPGFRGYYHLARPSSWLPVLDKFPELILNLAHNDTTGTVWQREILEIIDKHSNVYTDISYDTEMFYMPGRYFSSIKKMLNTPKIMDRILYGTDWYMGRFLWSEKSYMKWFTTRAKKIPWCRVEFTEKEIQKLTEENPMRFLNLESG